MKKTIILYNPKAVFFDMPLALISIGTQVCNEFKVVVIDARLDHSPEDLLKEHINDVLLVGVTSLTGAPLKDAIAFSQLVKKLDSQIPVIWGGWHTSLFPEQVLLDVPEVDVSVQGQGEVTFKELTDAIVQGIDFSEVRGIVYRDSNGVNVKNAPRAIVDVNDLPRLNYDLVDVERYFKAKGKRQFDFITSVGCFFRCTFCADPFVFSRKYSGLLPERIAADLLVYHEKYSFTDVNFQDETFFTYPARIVEMAELFIRSGKKFTWAATMRADQGSRMSLDDIRICQESGLRRLLIGVESGSQEMMDWLKKDIKMEQVLLCAERCRELGISVIFPFIVGFPHESDASVIETQSMIRTLAMMSTDFDTPIFYFKPYPGTQITDEVVERGEYVLPKTIHEWSEFDYIGSKGPWVSDEKYQLFERYKFYLKVNRQKNKWMNPVRWLARKRISRMNFKFPLEKKVIEFIRPKQSLS